MLNQSTRNINTCRLFKAQKSRRGVDLEDHRPRITLHQIHTAVAEAECSRRGNREPLLVRRRVVGLDRSPAGRVGPPFAIGGAETRRSNNRPADHHKTETVLASGQPSLDNDLVTDPPQRVENRLKMITGGAPDDSDTHPRPPLFHNRRQSQVTNCLCCQSLRIGAGKGRRHRQTGHGQGHSGCPMIAAYSDSSWRVGRRHAACDERLEDRQQALGTPVTDPRENGVGEFTIDFDCQGFQVAIAEQRRSGDSVDQLKIDSKIDRRFGEPSVCTKIWAGAQDQETHPLMVAQLIPIFPLFARSLSKHEVRAGAFVTRSRLILG